MSTLEPFDLAGTELQKGITLIEASAGTGKTFTIAGLILRLVLEKGIGIGRILAVTYTVAATEELRDRVRKRLRGALEDLRTKKPRDEITARSLKGGAVEKGIRDLEAAVQNFDEAQIFTIHGFCQRVLRESAFESGALFDMEMLPDASPMVEEVARDFWRQRFYTAPALLPRLAIALQKSHGGWLEIYKHVRNHPDIKILPEPGARDCAALARLLETKFAEIISEWKRSETTVTDILRTHKDLSQAEDAFKPVMVDKMVRSLSQMAENFDAAPPEALKAIFWLCKTQNVENLVKAKQAPKHGIFELSAGFSELTREFFHQLEHEFVEYAKREMPLRKERLNVVTYDDLLTRVRDAIRPPAGALFAKMLGARYDAALVDEFQDTDPVQYEIFSGIFAGGNHYLCYIGDPKQAIYSFRGADVFTYKLATGEASQGFTLNTNWRSEKPLLDAANLLFKKNPGLGEGIEYREVHPPQTPRAGFKPIENEDHPSRLRFRFLQSKVDGAEVNKGDAEEMIGAAVVADIARLKISGIKLGMEELKYGDMAVLARTNAQAAKIQALLRDKGIKSVLQTEKSVFETEEARELRLLIEGVLEPGRGHFLNTALTTSLVGFSPEEVAAFHEDETQQQEKLTRFLEYHAQWVASGFMAMFRRMLMQEKVRERLVLLPGGERKLANFLHLAELLHCAEAEERLTPEGVRLWLHEQANSRETAEEHQLRLESDDDGVFIATIHKSKGLEYPVVFCPFLWKESDQRYNDIVFHDRTENNRITLDLREGEESAQNEAAASRERTEEALRMLYVAVTRAQNLCHVYAGDIKGFDNSPLGLVLGAPPVRGILEQLAKKSGGSIGLSVINPDADQALKIQDLPEESGGEICARTFEGSIPQSRMIASFSGLISDGIKTGDEVDAIAANDPNPDADPTFAAISRFERGSRAGVFWHELLEKIDFQKPGALRPFVAEILASHGFDSIHTEAVGAQVRRLLAVPLEPGLKLEQVSAAEKLPEVEFTFPIASLEPGRLREVFAKHAAGHVADFSGNLGRLNFRPVEGFMRGFIDLFFRANGRFYILDWKSNWLGNRPEDYDVPGLQSSILHSFYFLQYHLYTVAADLFLRGRVPGYDYEKHFGGIFYVFLRGVDVETPARGVFRDRPSAALIRDLREVLTRGAR